MKSIYLAAALLLGAFAFAPAPAAAAPATALNIEGLFTASPVIEAQYRRDRRRDSRARHNYRAGQRYDRAPRGWNRYDRRPGNWRNRNCVMVGPVWFCP